MDANESDQNEISYENFGSAINGTMLSLKPGMVVKMTSAELGWREGLVQLRIDSRTTRIEIKSKP